MAVQQSWPKGAAAAEWRAHWPLVLGSLLGFTMIGVAFFSLGPFMASLEKAFGWSRSEITSGFTLYAVTCVICQPIVGRMIDRFGPRRIALTGIVVTGLLFYSRRDRLRQSEGTAIPPVETGLSTREALRSPSFWKLAIAIFVSFSLVMGFSIHMLPILTSVGLSRDKAALVAGSYGLFAVVGKFSYGLLATRFPGQVVAAAMMALPLASCALLLIPSPSVATC